MKMCLGCVSFVYVLYSYQSLRCFRARSTLRPEPEPNPLALAHGVTCIDEPALPQVKRSSARLHDARTRRSSLPYTGSPVTTNQVRVRRQGGGW